MKREDRETYGCYFPPDSPIGDYIDTIYEQMGEESVSSVLFRANNEGIPYTVKVYKEKIPLPDEEIEKKMQALRNLEDNERICRVKECFNYDSEEHSYSYVIMEYIHGEGLDTAIENKRYHRFPQNLVLNWACQLLEALTFLHAHHINVHLKLSNIVRRRNDSVCVSDISHFVSHQDEAPPPSSNNPDDQNSGGYPETDDKVIRFHEEQVKKDIYHLGAVLYQLLTGEKLDREFPLTNEQKRERLLDCKVFKGVADIIVKATDSEREARWDSAEDMERALLLLPLEDGRRKKHIAGIIRDSITFFLLLVAGFALFSIGNYRTSRRDEMDLLAKEAENEWNAGKYTEAWSAILKAMRKKSPFDPSWTTSVMAGAEKYAGVYQFEDGYQPFYSVSMNGQLTAAAVSPGETLAAVITRETDSASMQNVRLLHLLELESGREIEESPLRLSPDLATDFAFLDDDSIVYINELGQLSTFRRGEDAPPPISHGSRIIRFALSGDKKTIAYLCDNGLIYLDKIGADSQIAGEDQSVNPSAPADDPCSDAPEDRLFALNGDGSRLAISFAGQDPILNAKLRVYDFRDPAQYPAPYQDYPCEYYDHFEGGFYRQFVAWAGWRLNEQAVRNLEMGENRYLSGFYAIDLDSGSNFNRAYYAMLHASVNENGMYYAHKAFIEPLNFSAVADFSRAAAIESVSGNVSFLQCAPDAVLVITERAAAGSAGTNNTVSVLRENGAKTLTVSTGTDFTGGALSSNYLLLFGQSDTSSFVRTGNTLSVLKWKDADISMTYNGDYSHQRFQVLGDRSSAMLYGINKGSDEIARIYPLTKQEGDFAYQSVPPKPEEEPEEIQTARNLVYLRPQTENDPQEEYLKVEYPDGAAYYSARDGIRAKEAPGQYRSEEAPSGSALTKDYELRKNADGELEILGDKRQILNSIPAPGVLTGACQCENPNSLLVSLLDGDNHYCLLLDENQELIAEFSGMFSMLPDGSLYYDDQQGNIVRSEIYSKEKLLETLEEMRWNVRDDGK